MCVGYNLSTKQLRAVVHVKQAFGYGGGICSPGTVEYVRFYIDWNNDGNWQDVDMVSFRVYNILGNKPLEYAVTLKIDAGDVPCHVEKLPRVRAILSWNLPPPADPNYTPTWGSRLDINVHILPGITTKEEEYIPYIINVESMSVCDIDQVTGLANGHSTGTANFTAVDSPFGGIVTISGYIADPPHYLSGGNSCKAKV